MGKKITDYKTVVFDCDGVVLNSNKLKTQAFYNSALPYGKAAAEALVSYHIANGGISRYKKFSFFLEEVVPFRAAGHDGPPLASLLEDYAKRVKDSLLTCEVAAGLRDLREKTKEAKWLIVSGGDQEELREIFVKRHLADLFDGGIFGSPDTKDEILARELENGNVNTPALFLGDSRYDYISAVNAGLDFVFVSRWSEFSSWDKFASEKGIKSIDRVDDLLRQA